MENNIREISNQFRIYGDFIDAVPYGSGHINNTYKVTFDQGGAPVSYIFQKINTKIFKNPFTLMSNISRVINHQKNKMDNINSSTRRALTLIHTNDGCNMYDDKCNNFWRVYIFIDHAKTYDIMEENSLAFNAAKAYGEFQQTLVDLPGERLNETIPDFHNTPKRYDTFERAIKEDIGDRLKDVKEEVAFILSRKSLASKIIDFYKKGLIPERICHYDTKVNNVMMDDKNGEGICVIDLDTVMPGFVAFDFGDLVRTATSPVAEDEADVSKVTMRIDTFEALAKGYLAEAGDFLTQTEKDNLAFGALLITLENAVRFLTDYLQLDTYYKIHREGHNLDRARTQIALVKSMEEQFEKMNEVISQI